MPLLFLCHAFSKTVTQQEGCRSNCADLPSTIKDVCALLLKSSIADLTQSNLLFPNTLMLRFPGMLPAKLNQFEYLVQAKNIADFDLFLLVCQLSLLL